MDNYEIEKRDDSTEEISLLELWNKLWKNKFLIIIITAVLVVFGTIALFFYNRSNTEIINNFNYEFVGNGTNRFPDGSVYDYHEIVSPNFLSEVIKKDDRFSSVDVNELEISIKQIEDVEMSGNTEVSRRRYLELKLELSAFKNNEKLAEEFINLIHNTFLDKVKEKNKARAIVNYYEVEENLANFSSKDLDTLTYDEILDLIRMQNSVLSTDMNNFITTYGNVDVNGLTINTIESDYSFWFNNNINLGRIETEIFENGYIRNIEENHRRATLRLSQVKREIALNQAIIDELTDLVDTITLPNEINELSVFYKEIESRTIQNLYLEVEKVDLEKLLANTEINIDNDLDAFVLSITNKQNSVTNTYNDFKINYLDSITVYRQDRDNDEFIIDKPLNMILMVVVLGMVGVIGGSVVALIKESNKKEVVTEN